MAERFVSYLRVSTNRQGESGLGLEAQREAVVRLAERDGWVQVTEFVEIMSGKRSDRPKLREAIATARKHRATLVIAKLDRLGRKASHVLHLLDNAGIAFRFAEMPHASKLETGIRAVVAEEEGRAISARTKAALAAAKARGIKLGTYASRMPARERQRGQERGLETHLARTIDWATALRPDLLSIQSQGAVTLGAIAACLNERGIPARRGGEWQPVQVKRVLDLLGGV